MLPIGQVESAELRTRERRGPLRELQAGPYRVPGRGPREDTGVLNPGAARRHRVEGKKVLLKEKDTTQYPPHSTKDGLAVQPRMGRKPLLDI